MKYRNKDNDLKLEIMITIENLKDNRNEIIEFLTDKLGSENVKEGMEIIVNMIGFRDYNDLDVMDFVKCSIEDNGIENRVIFRNGRKSSVWLEEKRIETSRELMKHI